MATPILFLAQTYTGVANLPPVGTALAARRQMPGFVADYDVRGQAQVEAAAAARAPLEPLLADPGWRLGRPLIARQPTADWIRRRTPQSRAEWERFVTEAVAAQRALHADYLVVPGVEMAGGTGTDALQRQVAAARAAFRDRENNDPGWLARVCVHDEWLLDPVQRANLLDELSDLPDDFGVALHVRWGRRGGAAQDRPSLEALKAVVSALARDERDVILLNSGIVGWLASAWGVTGWSAGIPRNSWSDERRVRGGRARGSVNKLWFFEHALLRWVERAEHNRLGNQNGYRACRCSFCGQLAAGDPWSPSAPQHNLYTLGRLADRTAGATLAERTRNVGGILTRAQTDWVNCDAGTVLRTRAQSAPHLDLWQSVL